MSVARNHPGERPDSSGAVTAVMILCAFYYPSMTILLMFVLPVPGAHAALSAEPQPAAASVRGTPPPGLLVVQTAAAVPRTEVNVLAVIPLLEGDRPPGAAMLSNEEFPAS